MAPGDERRERRDSEVDESLPLSLSDVVARLGLTAAVEAAEVDIWNLGREAGDRGPVALARRGRVDRGNTRPEWPGR
jgi:hypothetical protein